ncbi:MAG: hypothetical protein KKH74_08905 [Gammaproteobacteria bacterium]|nr:hypothetical protein [Gammaproteobacteria bacterium]MBU1732628.1 hypothetical protein [Gammaproteobacteria bacterium]MBU1893491.1 hypothetical protein [Gammaproteobacteria bacterium]
MSIEKLLKIVSPDFVDEVAARAWSEQLSLFELLEEQRAGTSVMLYGSTFNTGSLLLHSILVPAQALESIEEDDLTNWQGNPYESWTCGLVTGGGMPSRVEFEKPLSRIGPNSLKNCQQLVFCRSFEGRGEDKRYFEIAQFLTHAHDLHWTPERRAWCRFDEQGDIDDVIQLAEVAGHNGYETATCIEIRREVLEMHMSATGTALVQMFDSTCVPKGFHGWGSGVEHSIKDEERGLYYRSHMEGHTGSYFRGVQIIKPQRTAEEFGAYLQERENQPKHYESFITQDWKNKRLTNVSCDPGSIASYFDKGSPLPFQTSPVFFKAAVLDKYKADPEKYSLDHRSISCRNSWHLQTYDVNEAGQVHTYIKYLGDLPHSEQIYWKSFNETPKGGISKRAFTTDFEGSFDQEPDSLRDLQSLLLELHVSKIKWFTLREPELVEQAHYPLTSSLKVWGDTLTTLAKLVNEGLERKYFETKVKELGSEGDPKWGSIRWAQEAMKVSGVADEVITEIVQPLRDLQNLRTKLGAHSGGAEAGGLRTSLLRQHKSPRGHIEHLCSQLVYSLQTLRELNKS